MPGQYVNHKIPIKHIQIDQQKKNHQKTCGEEN